MSRRTKFYIFVALLICVTFGLWFRMKPSHSAMEMPAFSPSLSAMKSFYQFEFLPDGYPSRAGAWAQPIYGVYILKDYLGQYKKSPTPELEKALKTVAYAALNRMQEYKGGLVFWYEDALERGSRLHTKHYSGLTQSYYAVIFYKVGKLFNDQVLVQASEKMFLSLTIPIEEGGVFHRTPYGPVIEEVPQHPSSVILNGWGSALLSIDEYATLSGSRQARAIFNESVLTMTKLLPLYDVPGVKNSLYCLTGFTHIRMTLPKEGAKITNMKIIVPNQEEHPVPVSDGEDTRWKNYFLKKGLTSIEGGVKFTGKTGEFNAILSLASFPDPNKIEFSFDAEEAMPIKMEIQVGSYDPRSSRPVENTWIEFANIAAEPGQKITVDVPMEIIKRIPYPTDFKSKINGKSTNLYHKIHLRILKSLYDKTGNDAFLTFHTKWSGYLQDWSMMPEYRGLYVKEGKGVQPLWSGVQG